MTDRGSSGARRNIRVKTPFLRKLVADVRDGARRLAALDDAPADEAESGDAPSPAGAEEAARSKERSARAAGVNDDPAPRASVPDGHQDSERLTPEDEQQRSGKPQTRERDLDIEPAAGSRGRATLPRQSARRQVPVAHDSAVQDARPKPYVSIAELAQLTPWSEQAIRTMMTRGVFAEGKHYFHVGRRAVFKWNEVCHFIDDGVPAPTEVAAPVPHYRDRRKT